MLVKPTDETSLALARFAESAEFKVIRDWMEKNREACMQASLHPDPALSRIHQGGFKMIDELLSTTQKAVQNGRR